MNDGLVTLTEPFLKKSINECTVQELQEIADTYPYFTSAQLTLLKKLKNDGLPAYDKQLQKAVLYYYDPLQFEAFINSEKFITEFDFTTSKIQAQPEVFTKEETTEAIETPEIETAEQNFNNTSEAEEKIPVESASPIISQENTAESVNTIAFEPYHTVDYFASQGIKLSKEEVSSDKISKQLKSFTEWLKTMKRLPAPDLTQNLDSSNEYKVQNLAAQSLDNADIVTEAMAEVWLKQGNKEKALEVYNKLSLQNPSKKAYFAAKIENLKI